MQDIAPPTLTAAVGHPAGGTWRLRRLWPVMAARNVPPVDGRYWLALCLASIAGCNLGDVVGIYLGWGHVAGLLPLAAVLLLPLTGKRLRRPSGEGWYRGVVLVRRTAATNIADMLSHTPFHPPYAWVLAGLEAV